MSFPPSSPGNGLVVRQQKEMLEIFTDFESRNRYSITHPNGVPAFYAAEAGQGAVQFLTRSFLKSARPFTMQLRDPSGSIAYRLDRPFTLWLSRMEVKDGTGRIIGTIEQRWVWFHRKFEIRDVSGLLLAELHGPWFRPWTFQIISAGQEIGRISKRWDGLGREMFTNADSFGVQFSPHMPPTVRTLALAATFLIDFLYFEHG